MPHTDPTIPSDSPVAVDENKQDVSFTPAAPPDTTVPERELPDFAGEFARATSFARGSVAEPRTVRVTPPSSSEPSSPKQDLLHPALTFRDRLGLMALLVVFVVLGFIVELRSAFLTRRMTDFGVYVRAAWAVRAGEDIYDITDDNYWHYQYPPAFAILMTPLADPPAGSGRAGTLPFAVSVALWYVFNLGCLFFAIDRLAGILENGSRNPLVRIQPAGCRRWWRLRVIPFLVCAVPTGQALVRGQVSFLLLAFLCAMTAALYRRHNFRAGLWLAAAVCLKVIPLFLLVLPLWKRDLRCLAGCALGLVLGLGVLPALVLGVPRTLQYYVEYDRKVLRPGMGDAPDRSRARELMELTATSNQSLQAMIHNTYYLDRNTRPAYADPLVRRSHWILGGCLTLATLWSAGWRRPLSAPALVLFFGALLFNMILISPICHLHYFCLVLPLVMGLLAASRERSKDGRPGKTLLVLLAFNFCAGLLPVIPGMELLRDICLASYGALVLWLAGCVLLWRQTRAEQIPLTSPRRAARLIT